jgi:hypothetical protein
MESGRVLEVDFSLDQDGAIAGSSMTQKTEELQPFKVQ